MKHEQKERELPNLPKWLYKFLLVADAAAIIVSMVSGPLERTGASIGAAASAIVLSLCLLLYGMYGWFQRNW